MTPKDRSLAQITRLLLAMLLTPLLACAPKSAENGAVPTHKEQVYINASLEFAMEHPQAWLTISAPNGPSEHPPWQISWKAPVVAGEEDASPQAKVNVWPGISFSGKAPDLQALITALHPELTLTAGPDEPFKGGSAKTFRSSAPQREYLLYFITSATYVYLLEFSAPPETFADHLGLFQEMAHSFTLLE